MIPTALRRPRTHKRRTFAGRLIGAELAVLRGAWVRSTDRQGDLVADTRDDRAIVRLELGDVAIVAEKAGPGIAAVEVVAIIAPGWSEQRFGVVVRCGRASGDAWIMPATGLRGSARKRQRRTEAARAA